MIKIYCEAYLVRCALIVSLPSAFPRNLENAIPGAALV